MEAKKVSESLTEQIHVLRYTDLNPAGRLFGGMLLAWIDEVAAVTAGRHCGCSVTTAAIDHTHFKSGAHLGDLVVLIGRVTWVGRTSMEVQIDTYTEGRNGIRELVNRAYFVMVAIDSKGRPTEVPGLILEDENQRREWENAKKRRELFLLRKKEGF